MTFEVKFNSHGPYKPIWTHMDPMFYQLKVSYASSSIADASSCCISTTSDDRTADLTPLCSTSSDTTALSEDNGTSSGLGNGPRRQSHRSHRHRHHSSGLHQNENLNTQGNASNDSCESPLFDVDCPHIPSSCSHHHFDKNENTRNR